MPGDETSWKKKRIDLCLKLFTHTQRLLYFICRYTMFSVCCSNAFFRFGVFMPRDTKVLRCVSRKSPLLCSRSWVWLLPPSFIHIMMLQRFSTCLWGGFAAHHFYRNTSILCPLVLPLWLRYQMTFRWWTLDEAKWEGSLKCTAGCCNHLPMEVRLRRLRRSHLRRFKRNRSEALCFFFLHNYPSGLCSRPKQHANEQTSENIHEAGSEIRTRLHLPFQSSTHLPKKLPFGSYLSRKAFITVLLHLASWFICECGYFTPFPPRRVFHSQLLQFDLVCISHISLSNLVCSQHQFHFLGLC